MGCRTQAGFRVRGHPGRSDPPKSWHVGRGQAHHVFLQGGREGRARRIQGSIPPSPKLLLLLLLFFFFFSFSFCPNLLERVPRSILKGQAMEGQGLWLQTSGCRNSLSLATVHHVGQVMRFLCCSHAFRETDSLRRTMQIVKCSLLRRRAQGRVSS